MPLMNKGAYSLQLLLKTRLRKSMRPGEGSAHLNMRVARSSNHVVFQTCRMTSMITAKICTSLAALANHSPTS